ncbi:MAG: hypothetical protein JNM12_15090 [Alphaproteobacteria bacterium]|nr:hypothetical protein [Alphaproteobacteria bacterium]
MPDTDLEDLKRVLQEQFRAAVKRQPSYEDSNYASSSTPHNPAIQNRMAIAELASALINLNREQREHRREQQEQEERKNGMKLPGK